MGAAGNCWATLGHAGQRWALRAGVLSCSLQGQRGTRRSRVTLFHLKADSDFTEFSSIEIVENHGSWHMQENGAIVGLYRSIPTGCQCHTKNLLSTSEARIAISQLWCPSPGHRLPLGTCMGTATYSTGDNTSSDHWNTGSMQ